MKIFTPWLRSFLPVLDVDDDQLAEDLTLRGIAVEGIDETNDAAGFSDGALFSMDITTNRVDSMNHFGVAREAAAIYNVPLHPLDCALPSAAPSASPIEVRIEAPDLCGRFTARVLRGVTIAPSHGRVAHYFEELGLKRISNAVDVSNFVLLGMGHPTHAFDLDKIAGAVVVRRAQPGESLKLLDGTTRTLSADDLVIADEAKALSLAGVMGGFDSMITAETKNILVEAGWFAPAAIRASSRRHMIHTDASHRFERGADFAAVPVANALVAKHILEACGGHLDGELVDVVIGSHQAETVGRAPIQLSLAEVRRHLGRTVAAEGLTDPLVRRFLCALGCTLAPTGDESYAVTLPSWRLDLAREIDLIEEIARVYGYNRFANTLPRPAIAVDHPTAHAQRAVERRLLALGYTQALSSTFASAAGCALFAPEQSAVALANPLNDEAANLRPSLLPGMVAMLAQNLHRDVLDVRLFETGTVFSGSEAAVFESASLALGITGECVFSKLYPAADAPFFQLKGAIESLVGLFEAPAISFSGTPVPTAFEPGRAAVALLGGKTFAFLGELAAGETRRRKLRQPLFVAAVDLAALLKLPLRRALAKELSRFQAVERDFSFTFLDTVSWEAVQAAVLSLGIEELRSLQPIELWRNREKYPGVYSTLVRTTFQSADRTLVEEELAGWSGSIISALQSLGGTLRS